MEGRTSVVVIGSGAAGLAAALAAADHGATVTVLERSDYVGGTTAVSGGGIWVPGNHLMTEADSRDDALTYCRRLVDGKMPDHLIETFVDTAPEVLRFLEDRSPLRLHQVSWPDYHPEIAGSRRLGRMVEPEVFDTSVLGDWAGRVRPAPVMHLPITLEEQTVTWRLGYTPEQLDVDVVKARSVGRQTTVGRALVGSLLAGCLDAGVSVLTGARARGLSRRAGNVEGVRCDGPDGATEFDGAVVLASGGFEWSEELKRAFLPGPLTHPTSPPTNEGDGLRMAMEAGAALANMSEAWWYPAYSVPGDEYDGRPLSRFVGTERSAPHCILVNRRGRRFVNEAANYNDMMKSFFDFDAASYRWSNIPCWSIMDAQHRRRYAVGGVRSTEPDPGWLLCGPSLTDLAAQAGIDPSALEATVDRFNHFARRGEDPDFGRGTSYYDCFHGDPGAPHPTLGPVEEPPFYALEVRPGCVGTKGGALTNSQAQVLDPYGGIIAGLYAAGNVAASPAGPAYFGGGCSIAMALTWGYIAGRQAARDVR